MATLSSSLSLSAPCITHKSSNSTRVSYRFLRIEANKRVKKIRQVILKEDLEGVGNIGDQVKVKAGFYRNFLLPTGKADLISPKLLKQMQLEKERIEAEKERVKDEAEQLASILQSVGPFKIKRYPTEAQGTIISRSVTPQDVSDIIKAQLNRVILKDSINIPEITEVGEYVAELILHEEVSARIRINVSPN